MPPMMMGPNGKPLPISIGASASSDVGGNSAEGITTDTGIRSAVPKSKPEPADPVVEPPPAAQPEVAPPVETPPAAAPAPVGDDEIDQLHQRFDVIESMIKRRLAIATLHGRFDALEEWLNNRFPA